MASSKTISFDYQEFDSREELSETQSDLVQSAITAFENAYAPYSQFKVGAAILMSNGSVIKGSNKENASFPAGTCAERNALGTASDQHPNSTIKSIAIACSSESLNSGEILAPCGICRQVMCETEANQAESIELLIQLPSGKVLQIDSVSKILPFHFNPSFLKK